MAEFLLNYKKTAMKINFYKIFTLLLLITSVIGCSKMEKEPLEPLTEDIVFDENDINGHYAYLALNHIYSHLPQGFNRIDNAFLDGATDDAIASERGSDIEILGQAMQSPTQTIDVRFAENYNGIRKANLFLSKIGVVPISDSVKNYMKAEARFLRAMFYFELIKRYGGVPMVGDQILDLNNNAQIAKSSFDQCVQYVVSECDAISGMLRKEPLPVNETGRATQGAALALKSRILLYAASPMNNPTGDIAKWQAAMDAAKAVIDLNYYTLNANFINLFVSRSNTELILAFQEARSQDVEKANAPIGYAGQNASSGRMSPTQEMVDAFGMNNGKAIADATSGYNAANPYVNRDPRFYATIFYNGAAWLNRGVEIFEGGQDRPGGIVTQTRTGYYLRKFMGDFANTGNYTNQDHNFIIFRYAEILLNYAEAANEVGQTAIAYMQLTAIRKRAGITAGTGNLYGLKASMSQSEMREAIRLERRLELAFEEHRFWDARRWKIAETAFNTTLHGVKVTQPSAGVFNYEIVPVATLSFAAPKMYLYPFPYVEVLRNKALVQNPGWQ